MAEQSLHPKPQLETRLSPRSNQGTDLLQDGVHGDVGLLQLLNALHASLAGKDLAHLKAALPEEVFCNDLGGIGARQGEGIMSYRKES